MTCHFVAEGRRRFLNSPEHQARLKVLWTSIADRYSDRWIEAGGFQRLLFLLRMYAEFQQERMGVEPSDTSLF